MYAGCVHWPLHLSPAVGGGIAGVIVLGGLIEAAVTARRPARAS